MKTTRLYTRSSWLRLFSLASNQDLENIVNSCGIESRCKTLSGPKTGIVTLRARISGVGQRFNAGDVCVTKTEVVMDEKVHGYATVMGGQGRRALLVAMLDAAMTSGVVEPLEALVHQLSLKREKTVAQRQQATAGSKVNFYTMVRGES